MKIYEDSLHKHGAVVVRVRVDSADPSVVVLEFSGKEVKLEYASARALVPMLQHAAHMAANAKKALDKVVSTGVAAEVPA